MKLFIPACGYRIRLVKDWQFELYFEHRNDALVKVLAPDEMIVGDRYNWRYKNGGCTRTWEPRSCRALIPSGTILEVDRVYVRRQSKTAETKEDDYDSVSFRVVESDWVGGKHPRFWAKLRDVNEIEYDVPANADVKERPMKKPKLTPV
jgi:hypothetical protein